MRKILLTIITVTLCIFSSACGKGAAPTVRTTFAFDTFLTVRIYSCETDATEAIDSCTTIISGLESKLSATIESSYISLINKNGYCNPIKVDKETYELIKNCVELCRATDGTFDITLGKITDLWGFGTESPAMPDAYELAALAGKRSYDNIIFNDNELSVKLSSDDFAIDLGAAAKGYALDVLKEHLKENGVTSAIIDFGGCIMTVGENENRKVTVTDHNAEVAGSLTIKEECVSTSNGLNRYVEHKGVKYHHIIDPLTGYPAQSGVASCTVGGRNGLVCDAMSTAFFVMGVEKAQEYCRKHDEVYFIITTDKGEVVLSDNINGRFIMDGKIDG